LNHDAVVFVGWVRSNPGQAVFRPWLRLTLRATSPALGRTAAGPHQSPQLQGHHGFGIHRVSVDLGNVEGVYVRVSAFAESASVTAIVVTVRMAAAPILIVSPVLHGESSRSVENRQNASLGRFRWVRRAFP
jgi:hypothetical protein